MTTQSTPKAGVVANDVAAWLVDPNGAQVDLGASIGALTETAPATDTASSGLNGRMQRIAQRLTSLIALIPAALGQGTMAQSLRVVLASDQTPSPVTWPVTVTSTMARATGTTQYTANDVWSDSASAPTAGGYTITGAGRASGGAGRITDVAIISSNDPATPLQGELWIFDSAPTAVNDNLAFALSDADALKLVTVIPFTLLSSQAGSGTNSVAIIPGPIGNFTCIGSANLRCLVKVKNAYTPADSETLSVRFKIEQLT
jgi:hypothetical protein